MSRIFSKIYFKFYSNVKIFSKIYFKFYSNVTTHNQIYDLKKIKNKK